jgi:hypothetical protein
VCRGFQASPPSSLAGAAMARRGPNSPGGTRPSALCSRPSERFHGIRSNQGRTSCTAWSRT